MPRRGEVVMALRFEDGRLQKRCSRCGEWKDVAEGFYTRKNARVGGDGGDRIPRPWCKKCDNATAGARHAPNAYHHGTVAWRNLAGYVNEAIKRVGQAEFARRAGVTQQALWSVRKGRRLRVRKDTAVRLLSAAREVIRSGEVRSKGEIWYGRERRRLHAESNGSAEGLHGREGVDLRARSTGNGDGTTDGDQDPRTVTTDRQDD